jgi:hypothetical protein
MRKQIFNKAKPVAGIFIGGLEGIGAEVALFRGIRNGRPTYFLGAPGRRTGICRERTCRVQSPQYRICGINNQRSQVVVKNQQMRWAHRVAHLP